MIYFCLSFYTPYSLKGLFCGCSHNSNSFGDLILDRSCNLTVSCMKLRVSFVAVRVSLCPRYPNSSDVFIYLNGGNKLILSLYLISLYSIMRYNFASVRAC